MKMRMRNLFAICMMLVAMVSLLSVNADAQTPTAPTTLTTAKATIEWGAVVDSTLTGYKVYRGTGSTICNNATSVLGPLLVAGTAVTVPAGTTTFVDNAIPAVNGPVCYEVTAYNAAGESGRSNRAQGMLTVNPPSGPQNLRIVVP